MAATRLIALHINKGKSLAQCLEARTDYAKNPDKTRRGELVTAYACDPETCGEEFLLSKRKYQQSFGKCHKRDVIAYQIRQSFRPGEITPEEANRLGRELALRFTKGRYAFIVATHTDREHIHNHIVYNSTAIDGSRKFRNFWFSGLALQRCSDLICLENGLSVIEPKPYGERENRVQCPGGKKQTEDREGRSRTQYPERETFRDILRRDMDQILMSPPPDLASFLREMQTAGYEVKRGKQISVRGKKQKRFIRLSSLGEGYDEEAIRQKLSEMNRNGIGAERKNKAGAESRIKTGAENTIRVGSEKRIRAEAENRVRADAESKIRTEAERKTSAGSESKMGLLIDIQRKMQDKGPAYRRWATVYNLKQMSKTLLFLRDHGIDDMEKLSEELKVQTSRRDQLLNELRQEEERLTGIGELKKHIIDYAKTREVYEEYRRSGYSKQFLAAHREEILNHKMAKAAFAGFGGKKIPKVKELSAEYAAVLAEKRKTYAAYREARAAAQKLLIAEKNVRALYATEGKSTAAVAKEDKNSRGSHAER